MKRVLSIFLLVLVSAAGCAKSSQPPYAEDPWVREPPPGMSMLAGYMILHNPSSFELTLTGASSPDFAAVEFHNSVMEDGVSRMRQETSLVLGAGEALRFVPGGRHMMLIAPGRQFSEGDKVLIELSFSDGSELHITAPVRSGGGH
jgi:copper(I)-binding protein